MTTKKKQKPTPPGRRKRRVVVEMPSDLVASLEARRREQGQSVTWQVEQGVRLWLSQQERGR